jgi:hypothetical protein
MSRCPTLHTCARRSKSYARASRKPFRFEFRLEQLPNPDLSPSTPTWKGGGGKMGFWELLDWLMEAAEEIILDLDEG